MPMNCIATDVKSMLSSRYFGEEDGTVTWKGNPVVDVILDDADIEIELDTGGTEIVRQSVLTGASADFLGVADGDVIVASGSTFKVRFWKDDGTGQIDLYLEKQS